MRQRSAMRTRLLGVPAAALMALSPAAHAEDISDLKAQLRILMEKVQALESQQAPKSTGPAPATALGSAARSEPAENAPQPVRSSTAESAPQVPPAGGVHTAFKGVDLTIYGVADIFLSRYQTGAQGKTTLDSGGATASRLGFLASKAVNPELRIGARYEMGVNLDLGTSSSTNGVSNRVFGKQAFLFMQTKYGTLQAGRLQAPSFDWLATYDPALLPPADSFGALTTLGSGNPGVPSGTGLPTGFSINPFTRLDNAVEYISPRWNGLLAKAAFSVNEASLTQANVWDLSLTYEKGPLSVGYTVHHTGSTAGSATVKRVDSMIEHGVGASYNFGFIKPYVTLLFKDVTDPTIGPNGSVLNGNSERIGIVGAVVPLTASSQLRSTLGKYFSGSPGRDATSLAVVYTYQFDESLLGYLGYSHLRQGALGQWRLFNSPTPNAGDSVNGYMAGLTWRF